MFAPALQSPTPSALPGEGTYITADQIRAALDTAPIAIVGGGGSLGRGKTTAIMALVAEKLAKGKRVVVLANGVALSLSHADRGHVEPYVSLTPTGKLDRKQWLTGSASACVLSAGRIALPGDEVAAGVSTIAGGIAPVDLLVIDESVSCFSSLASDLDQTGERYSALLRVARSALEHGGRIILADAFAGDAEEHFATVLGVQVARVTPAPHPALGEGAWTVRELDLALLLAELYGTVAAGIPVYVSVSSPIAGEALRRDLAERYPGITVGTAYGRDGELRARGCDGIRRWPPGATSGTPLSGGDWWANADVVIATSAVGAGHSITRPMRVFVVGGDRILGDVRDTLQAAFRVRSPLPRADDGKPEITMSLPRYAASSPRRAPNVLSATERLKRRSKAGYAATVATKDRTRLCTVVETEQVAWGWAGPTGGKRPADALRAYLAEVGADYVDESGAEIDSATIAAHRKLRALFRSLRRQASDAVFTAGKAETLTDTEAGRRLADQGLTGVSVAEALVHEHRMLVCHAADAESFHAREGLAETIPVAAVALDLADQPAGSVAEATIIATARVADYERQVECLDPVLRTARQVAAALRYLSADGDTALGAAMMAGYKPRLPSIADYGHLSPDEAAEVYDAALTAAADPIPHLRRLLARAGLRVRRAPGWTPENQRWRLANLDRVVALTAYLRSRKYVPHTFPRPHGWRERQIAVLGLGVPPGPPMSAWKLCGATGSASVDTGVL